MAPTMAHWLPTVVTVAVVLWIMGSIFLGSWAFFLSLQRFNRIISPPTSIFDWGRPKMAFQTDPAEFDEIGKEYRRKGIKIEALLLLWGFGFPILLAVIFGK
jgi:hypothetical protein